jgi:NAD(P)-dependent dehydrogenase (short-subunit alcohol dehydrogenase family)
MIASLILAVRFLTQLLVGALGVGRESVETALQLVADGVHSPLEFLMLAMYGASKSAAWALTNGLRHELRAQGTQVLGMHVGFVDTDLTRGIDLPKSSPELIVRRTLDALEAGAEEVLADERARQLKQGLSAEPGVYLLDPSAGAPVAPVAAG